MKIDSPDQENIVGEIILRGDNVMLGYYKNEDATQAMSLTRRDGCIPETSGVIDKDGNIYIKGEAKTCCWAPQARTYIRKR
ncbi:MAG: hypothetical protein MZV63_37635 [Marinilabiliales bacterium]|nr:hypothetical protein [Marinilabiliales bacterium]